MVREVSFGPLRDSLTTPTYENVFRERGVWVFDFDKRKLDLAIREFVHKVREFTLCQTLAKRFKHQRAKRWT